MKKNLGLPLTEESKPVEPKSIVRPYDIMGDIAVMKMSPDVKFDNQTVAKAVLYMHLHVKTTKPSHCDLRRL